MTDPIDPVIPDEVTPSSEESPKKKSRPRLIGGTEAAPANPDPHDPRDSLPPRFTEDNAAELFTGRYADTLRYVAAWGKWMEWDGTRWKEDKILRVFDLVRKICREIQDEALRDPILTAAQKIRVVGAYGAGKTIASVEKILRSDPLHASRAEDWDKDPWMLNTPGGVVDLNTGLLRPCVQDDYMTKSTSVSPAKDASCPSWHAFLDSSLGENAIELKLFLQRMCGYALTGSIKEHALFFIYGTGGNGKGTFLGVIQGIMADYAQVAGMDVFIEQHGSRHPTEIASLMGSRLVTAQETQEGKRWAEARIKAMTGGDLIRARYMRMDEFTFAPQFKLVIAGNHKPGLRNVDEAIKRRMNLIPFTVTIAPKDRDKELPNKLTAEAPQILKWMIEGCQDWLKYGLQQPDCVKVATDQYLEDQDVLHEWIESECSVNPNKKGSSTLLYENYKAFSERANEYVMPSKAWAEKLESRGFPKRKSHGVKVVEGLDLKPKRDVDLLD